MIGLILFGICSLSTAAGYTIHICNKKKQRKNKKNVRINTNFIRLDNDEIVLLDDELENEKI